MKAREMNKLNMKQIAKALLLAGLMAGLTACGGGGSSSGAGGSDTSPSTLGDMPAAPTDSTVPTPSPADPAASADPSPADPVDPAAPAPGVVVPAPGVDLGLIVDPHGPAFDLIDGSQTITAHTKDKNNRTEQWTYHINRILGRLTINTPDGDTFTGTVNEHNTYIARGHSIWHNVLETCSGEIAVSGPLNDATGRLGLYHDQGTCRIGHLPGHPYDYRRLIYKD